MGGLLGSLPTTPQHLRIHGGVVVSRGCCCFTGVLLFHGGVVVGVLLCSPEGGFGSGAGAVASPDTAVFRLM